MRRLFSAFAGGDRGEQAQGEPPIVIVGLGNPGPEHAHNRHNVGFWTVNRLARRAGMNFTRRGRLASLAEGEISGYHVILAKPQTFVNRSGEAVRDLLRRYHVDPASLIVIYDELDLPLGALRIREQGSHGGQNGMRSIIGAIGSQSFPRVRIGIGRPLADGEPTRDPEYVAAYVLADPPAHEREQIEETVARAVDAVEAIVSDGVASAMARFNSGK
jgi:PTH1 family peptidyl-tRNA hydrolase